MDNEATLTTMLDNARRLAARGETESVCRLLVDAFAMLHATVERLSAQQTLRSIEPFDDLSWR